MRWMRGRTRLATVALAVAAAVVAGGCSGGTGRSDKAGGSGAPVVLRMANTAARLEYAPAVKDFVRRVNERSGGNVRIQVVDRWGEFSADAEQQVVRAVAAGKVDLGWAGTRVFDTMGVTSFQALQAPMLIDSYALERAVIASDLPRRMLPGLDHVGVAGLAVLADGLRKPIGVKRPVLGLADWRAMTFGTYRSEVQAQAIRSLGATPVEALGTARDQALKDSKLRGFELSLLVYQMSILEIPAPYVTANVNLWPQMDALIVNPGRFAALTDQERGWVRQAATDATLRSPDLADRDAQNLSLACRGGGRFQNASASDLAALRKAFGPVYQELERNSQTTVFIKMIQELKRSTRAEKPLTIPDNCTGPAPVAPTQGSGTGPSNLNGTYRFTITKRDALASPTEDKSPDHLATFPWIFTATLKDGRWTLSHTGGEVQTDSSGDSYSVQGDHISFDWTSEDVLTLHTRWTIGATST
jgi:TRAP-type transport system periplasmic protein